MDNLKVLIVLDNDLSFTVMIGELAISILDLGLPGLGFAITMLSGKFLSLCHKCCIVRGPDELTHDFGTQF